MRFKNTISLSLCLALTLSAASFTTGCSQDPASSQESATASSVKEDKSNQSLFVEAYLDLLCKQNFDSYAAACGLDVSKVKEDYPKLLDNVTDLFVTYEFSDAENEKLREELKKIFGSCKYTVKEAVKNDDDSYTVPVEINKLCVFNQALKQANKDYDKWVKTQPDDAEEEALTDQFIEFVIEHCEEELSVPEYKDTKTIQVQLTPSISDPDVYEYNSEDLGSLLAALIDFSAWEKDVEDEEPTVE